MQNNGTSEVLRQASDDEAMHMMAAKRGRTEVPNDLPAHLNDSPVCKAMLDSFTAPWDSEAWRRALTSASKREVQKIIEILEEKHLTVPQVA